MVIVALVGCGSATPSLNTEDRATVSAAAAALGALTLNGSEPGYALHMQRVLLKLCDEKSQAKYDERTVGEVGREIAEDLARYTYGAWAEQLRDHCKRPT